MTGKNDRLSIKQWSEDDRPREKLLKKGARSLTTAELIAILIGSGTRDKTAVDVAQDILAEYNQSLGILCKKNVTDLSKIKGIGQAKAVTIVAALELGRRRKDENPKAQRKIISSKDVYDYFYPILADIPHEEFYALFLRRNNTIINEVMVSGGGVSGTVVDPKMVFNIALERLASGIILCHNHPSGNAKPSEADIQITRRIKKAGDLLEIKLLDHIIFTDNAYFSFADEGMI